jgi:hypothetical protein
VWFLAEAFERAHSSGQISPDEPFDPWAFLIIPGLKGRFPLWLSAEPRSKLQRLQQQGKCLDFAPAEIVGGLDSYPAHFARAAQDYVPIANAFGKAVPRT